MSSLTNRKQQADRCIATIKEWKNHTTQAMDAVQRLHDDGLWKEAGYDSFKDAIEIGCGITKQWGYELLKTAQARKQLSEPPGVNAVDSGSPTLQPLTKAEASQISPAIRKQIAGLPTGAQVEAIRAAAAAGPVTAKAIEREAAKLTPPEPTVQLDEAGVEIPAELIPEWERAAELGKHLRKLVSEVKVAMENGIGSDCVWGEFSNSDTSDAVQLHWKLAHLIPVYVCPWCAGHRIYQKAWTQKITSVKRDKGKRCVDCRGRGFVSKALYNASGWRPEK